MDVLYDTLYFLIGFIVGIIIMVFYIRRQNSKKKHTIGTIRIDTSDLDGPYIFLELKEGFSELFYKDQVLLDVKKENLLPKIKEEALIQQKLIEHESLTR